MKLRPVNLSKDISLINSWAISRNLNIMPEHRLSTFGLLAYTDEKQIGACFLYPFKGSGWCMMECLITNPDSTKEERSFAIEKLFLELSNAARILGYREVFITSYLPSVNNKLDSIGFIKNMDKVNHFIGRLV
jgi:N-acetylglutamate synthase-like GNAT family acetyltransferase